MSNKIVCPYCGTLNDSEASVCGTEHGGCGGPLSNSQVIAIKVEVETPQIADEDDWDLKNRERIEEIDQILEEAWKDYNPAIDRLLKFAFVGVIILFWLVFPKAVALFLEAGIPWYLTIIMPISVTFVMGLGFVKSHLTVAIYESYIRRDLES